ncbi:MAG TPA: hypothetical protein PLL64_07335 [Rhodothermales bacterium]|nr:hypothetical protein [Rhodothermales bacterium]HRR07597.1 hypothetical protein [Rhodothermales bacterium]
MKKMLWLCAGVLMAWPVMAQQTSSPTTEDPQNVRNKRFAGVMPTYQSWTIEAASGETLSLGQVSNQVLVYYQVNNQVLMSLRNSQGRFDADCEACLNPTSTRQTFSGVGDTQVSLSYRLPNPNLIFNATVNLPTGRSSLTSEELETVGLFSNQVLEFKLPVLGQGTALMTSVSGAFPLGEQAVLGGGLSYIVNGGFKPLTDLEAEYKPGNEVSADVGVNFKMGSNGSLGMDAMITRYNEDYFVEKAVFKAGTKISTVLQYRHLNSTTEWAALVRYRSREKNAIASFVGETPAEEATNSNPAVMMARATYRMNLNKAFVPGFSVEMRSYAATPAWLSGALIGGIGFDPEFRLNESILIPLRIRFVSGTVSNQGYYPNTRSLRNLSASVGFYWSF